MKNKQKFLSQALIEFINVEILFKDGDTSLISYFKVIIKNANELKIDLIDYPNRYWVVRRTRAPTCSRSASTCTK